MENPQAADGYRLDVTDFGPISEASVDLRPLTIFIGPSNTGKSYLAVLIYALQQCFGGQGGGSFLPAPGFLRSWALGLPTELSPEAELSRASMGKSVEEWLSQGEKNRCPHYQRTWWRISSLVWKKPGALVSVWSEKCGGASELTVLAN